jgi:hypothetical protein
MAWLTRRASSSFAILYCLSGRVSSGGGLRASARGSKGLRCGVGIVRGAKGALTQRTQRLTRVIWPAQARNQLLFPKRLFELPTPDDILSIFILLLNITWPAGNTTGYTEIWRMWRLGVISVLHTKQGIPNFPRHRNHQRIYRRFSIPI